MEIKYHKNFVKNFKKRFRDKENIRKRYKERLQLFKDNPRNPLLEDHSLKGRKLNYRSFSIAGDIRVVYIEIEGTIYFLDIGSHNQVY